VYGFVKQSGGHLKIYSEVGKGTSIKIYLPRHARTTDADSEDERPQKSLPEGQREVILVVDDEEAVRGLAVEALRELGYRVLEAASGQAALAIIDAVPGIDLLFTDIVMPEMNGRRLAEEARLRRPSLRVLFTTGYTRNAVVHNGVVDAGVQIVGKPYTLDELAEKVRGVLDEGLANSW
jgi:CheY-like chemotaxis protein